MVEAIQKLEPEVAKLYTRLEEQESNKDLYRVNRQIFYGGAFPSFVLVKKIENVSNSELMILLLTFRILKVDDKILARIVFDRLRKSDSIDKYSSWKI